MSLLRRQGGERDRRAARGHGAHHTSRLGETARLALPRPRRARNAQRASRVVSQVQLSRARRTEIEEVFEHALDLDPDRRDAWLSERCAQDRELRAEVAALL